MPLHMEQLHWMPSPPLVPEDSAIDVQHLGRMTLGEAALETEVLALFAAQSRDLVGRLAAFPADAAALASWDGRDDARSSYRAMSSSLEFESVRTSAPPTASVWL